MPRPRVAKTVSVVLGFCVIAQAIAEAMKGAVHGVARTVVTTPLR